MLHNTPGRYSNYLFLGFSSERDLKKKSLKFGPNCYLPSDRHLFWLRHWLMNPTPETLGRGEGKFAAAASPFRYRVL
jgi:hypothetical protein